MDVNYKYKKTNLTFSEGRYVIFNLEGANKQNHFFREYIKDGKF